MKELRWCTSTSAAHSLVKYFQASQEMLVLRWFLLNREDEGEAAGLERTKSENIWNMSEKNTLMCAKIDSAVRALAVDYVSHSPIQVAVVGRARTCKSLLQKDEKKVGEGGKKEGQQRWVQIIISVRWPQQYCSEQIWTCRTHRRAVAVIDKENKYLLARNLIQA